MEYFTPTPLLYFQALQRVCTDNMNLLQQALFHGKRYDKIAERKQRALFQSLYLVEIQQLRVLKELLSCSCLESAAEWWAGKYQLRYQMNKGDRFRSCPVEISVGSVLIPHGFEYYGEMGSFHAGISWSYMFLEPAQAGVLKQCRTLFWRLC